MASPTCWSAPGGYNSGRGKAYVYHGSPAGLGLSPAWSAVGENSGDYFGNSVAPAGDVNGDGFSDVLVAALDYNSGRGKAYVYHGSPAGLGLSPAWSAVGENGGDYFGYSVAPAGDVNGDGFSDVLVAAPDYNSGRGKAYVYHGSPAGLGLSPAWSAVGENGGDYFGISVASAGDVNGDGFADVLVGAVGYNSSRGKAYVYHGSPAGLGLSPSWSAVGENGGDNYGYSVASAGDVNDDGFSDVLVGAWTYNSYRGKAYVYHGSPAGLGLSPAWSALGENVRDYFGWSVASAGDVNGDGFADVLVGACYHNSGRGKAYVYHGSPAGLGLSPAWSAVGENSGDYFGNSVASAGDVNGDGFADVLVGARWYNSDRGKAYVYHGSALGLTPAFDWSAPGANADDRFGFSISTAGDVNADGYSDVLVGAWGYDEQDANDKGKAYLFPGSPQGLSASPLWSVSGENPGDRLGWSVAPAGDVNGDGFADVIVGARGHNVSRGKAYVFHGSAAGLSASPAWAALGQNAGDEFGAPVAAAGDVNGDGFADVVVGAEGYPQGTGFGKIYVYHGSASGLSAGPARTTTGEAAGNRFGHAAGTAGDVNGDGYADVVVGAWRWGSDSGKVYVYHGSSSGLGLSPAWSANGENAGDYFGWSAAGAGDVDGDGYADLLVGAWGVNINQGLAYLYQGGVAGLGGSPGLTLSGENISDYFGYSVATAGDLNGDGYADVIVGASGYNTSAGKLYVYYGTASGPSATPAWTSEGTQGADHFASAVSTAGDVNGDGYADVLAGAWGYDEPGKVNTGRVYVYHGSGAGLKAASWTPLAMGAFDLDQLGFSISSAGDVNGDGFADVLAGAPGNDQNGEDTGKAYLYYGSPDGMSPMPVWNAYGEEEEDSFGSSVAMAGDVNGDGYADLVVSAERYNSMRGKVYLYMGSASGPNLNPDWTATGENAGDEFGVSVASAGDINGDGYTDVAIGARSYDGFRGKVYIYYGSALGLATTAAWSAEGEYAGDQFGASVALTGDVYGDGYADVVIGAVGYDNFRGKAYVYNGSAQGISGYFDWVALGESTGDQFGTSVNTAGDVDGDGFADVIVGARGFDSYRGKAYVYHGSLHGLDVPFITFNGWDHWDEFGGSVGTAGDVNGDGYADVVIGATGYYTGTGRVLRLPRFGGCNGLRVCLVVQWGERGGCVWWLGWYGGGRERRRLR